MDLKSNNCYKCKWKRSVAGNCHIECVRPDPDMTGDPHGMKNGWFIYPMLFDPIWMTKECINFHDKEDETVSISKKANLEWLIERDGNVIGLAVDARNVPETTIAMTEWKYGQRPVIILRRFVKDDPGLVSEILDKLSKIAPPEEFEVVYHGEV